MVEPVDIPESGALTLLEDETNIALLKDKLDESDDSEEEDAVAVGHYWGFYTDIKKRRKDKSLRVISLQQGILQLVVSAKGFTINVEQWVYWKAQDITATATAIVKKKKNGWKYGKIISQNEEKVEIVCHEDFNERIYCIAKQRIWVPKERLITKGAGEWTFF